MNVSVEYLQRCAEQTGYRIEPLEKVVRLGGMAADLARHAFYGLSLCRRAAACADAAATLAGRDTAHGSSAVAVRRGHHLARQGSGVRPRDRPRRRQLQRPQSLCSDDARIEVPDHRFAKAVHRAEGVC